MSSIFKIINKTYMNHHVDFSLLVWVKVDEYGQGQERQEEAVWDMRKANGQMVNENRQKYTKDFKFL